MKLKCLTYVLLVFSLSCNNSTENSKENATADQTFSSTDFTEEDAFTSGIEGPATDASGNIYVVNYGEKGTIGKVNTDGAAALFVKLPEGSTGNGIRIDQNGQLFVADYTGHNVLQINPDNKEIKVFAHNPEMNQPNDLAITGKGTLFASDPNWQEATGNLWRIDRDGSTHLLEENMGTTNGVEVSPDEKKLYVNESVQRNVWVYDLSPDGVISNKRKLIQFPDFGMDGMRCDVQGNLYITRYDKGTIAIVSPEGELLKEVVLKGKKPSNITFGGKDGKTCYVTLQDRGMLETFRAEEPGREWVLSNK